jgi:deoxyadenosine/deoxycytidine kinase
MVPVLIVTGPVGVGKSTVLCEADVLLVRAGMRHATVDLDEIARAWSDDPDLGRRLVRDNLTSLWANFSAEGARRLLVGGLLESRSDLARMVDGIPGASTVVVRLDAPLAVLEQRLRRRQPGSEEEISAARWWHRHLDRTRIEDHVVAADARGAVDIAREVLRVAGWLDD